MMEIQNLYEKISQAIIDGDNVECVKNLSQQEQEVLQQVDEEGRTPVFLASWKGRVECLKYFIERKVDVNRSNNKGWTPVIIACAKSNLDCLTELVNNGGDINKANQKGNTPLHLACHFGHTACVKFLLDCFASTDVQNKQGFIPLYTACKEGRLGCVDILLQSGGRGFSCGKSPINIASQNGHADCLARLLEEPDGVQWLESHTAGLGPLYLACQNGHLDCVRCLLKYNVNVNQIKDEYGYNPLLIACQKGFNDIVEALLNHNANWAHTARDGSTALHIACLCRQPTVVQTLLDICASDMVNQADNGGFTPLCCLADGLKQNIDSDDVLKVANGLISAGADITASGWNRNTALHLAAVRGNASLVQLLLSMTRGNEICNKPNALQYTPQHLAIQEGHNDIVCLIETHCEEIGSTLHPFPQPLSPQSFEQMAQGMSSYICLEHVKLLKREVVLAAGQLIPYSECNHTTFLDAINGEVQKADKDSGKNIEVLFFSHRWGSSNHPDPSQEQYALLSDFLRETEAGRAVDYVWIDYSCISQDLGSEDFKCHLANIPTAIACANKLLIIPRLDTVSKNRKAVCTNLLDYLKRAWCSLEWMAAMISSTKLFLAFQVGTAKSFEEFDLPSTAGHSMGFYSAFQNVWDKLWLEKHKDFISVPQNSIKAFWKTEEPCRLLDLFVQITAKLKSSHLELEQKVNQMELSACDMSQIPQMQELYNSLGDTFCEADKMIVFNILLFLGLVYFDRPRPVLKQEVNRQDSTRSQKSSKITSKVCCLA